MQSHSSFGEVLMIASSNLSFMAKIFDWLQIPVFKPKETKFFYHIVVQTLQHRRSTKTRYQT